MTTFKGVCAALRNTQPMAFILENVDSLDSANAEDDREYTRLDITWEMSQSFLLSHSRC